MVHQANAPVYALHHRVVDSVAVDAAGGGDPGDRLAVTAVEGKRVEVGERRAVCFQRFGLNCEVLPCYAKGIRDGFHGVRPNRTSAMTDAGQVERKRSALM